MTSQLDTLRLALNRSASVYRPHEIRPGCRERTISLSQLQRLAADIADKILRNRKVHPRSAGRLISFRDSPPASDFRGQTSRKRRAPQIPGELEFILLHPPR